MIKTIRHKGLKRLFEQDDPSGVNPEHARKLWNIPATLPAAPTVAHMELPRFRLHPLKGEMRDFRAVTVRANWREVFRFNDGAEEVDYVDYYCKEATHDHEKSAAPRRYCVGRVH